MTEIRFHGRGGQGAVTSAQILALAAIGRGRFAQAFPSFGPERRGAPVVAYVRVSDDPIRNRSAIRTPDLVIVLEPSLLRLVKVDAGLRPGGTIILNSTHDPDKLRKECGFRARLAIVDANSIARSEIGRVITNTVMLGALLKATGLIEGEAVVEAMRDQLGPIAARNVKAFERAFKETTVHEAV